MNKRNNVILTFIALIILISGLYIFTDWFSKTTGFSPPEQNNQSPYYFYLDRIVVGILAIILITVLLTKLKKENG
jgi:hypothetical protein